MRVGIPLFGRDISPWFCFAGDMLIVTLNGPDGARREENRERVTLAGATWPERLALLERMRVDVLLCGGLPRRLLAHAEASGVSVVVGVGGEVERVLDAFRRGVLHEVTIGAPRDGRLGRRRRVRRRRRGPRGPGGS